MNALVESAMDAVGRLEASEGDTVDQWRKDFRKTVIDRGLEDMLSDKVRATRRLWDAAMKLQSLTCLLCRHCTPPKRPKLQMNPTDS